MTTDLTTLSALVSAIADWDAGDTPTSHLLETVFEVFRAAVPSAQSLRLYRVSAGYLVELGVTEAENTAKVTDTNRYPVLAKVLEKQAPTTSDDGITWYYAPRRAGRQSVMLELALNQRPDAKDTILAWVQLLGDEMAAAVQRRSTKLLVQRQAIATSRIANAASFQDLARAIAQDILSRGQFITLNIFRYDASGNLIGFRTIAAANKREAFETNLEVQITSQDLKGRLLELVTEGKRQVFNDIQTAPDVLDELKRTDDGTPIIATISFPMIVQGQIIGVVAYNDLSAPIDLSEDELDLMQSIADQTGAVISLRNLAEVTTSARQAVENIVSASRMIASATDYGQMAEAVTYTLAQNLTGTSVTLFDRPLEAGEAPKMHYLVGMSTANGTTTLAEPVLLTPPSRHQIKNLHAGLPVLMEPERVPDLIPQEVINLMNLGTQEWMAVFGLRAGAVMLGTLTVVSKVDVKLNEDLISAYITLADQIGLAIRSRQLLRDSEEVQAVASQLILAEQAIAEAEDYTEMSRIVLQLLPVQVFGVIMILFDRSATIEEPPQTMTLESFVTREDAQPTPRITDLVNPDFPRWKPGFNALSEGEFIFREEVDPKNSVTPKIIGYYGELGIISFITTGLRAGRRVVGLLALAKEPGFQPALGQLENIRSIADQVGITIENRYLLQQTADNLQQTQALYAVTRDLINVQSEADILRVMYQQVLSDAAGVALVRVAYDVAMPESLQINSVYDGKIREPQQTLNLEALPEFLVAQSRQMVDFIEKLQPDSVEAVVFQAAGLPSAGGAVVVPVYDEDRLARLIMVSYAEPRLFDGEFQRLINAIRAQVEIVLQNQRLLTEMQKAAARLGAQVRVLQTINHMSTVITGALDQQTLFDNTSEAMYNALSVDHVGLALYNPTTDTSTVVSEYPKDGAVGVVIGMDDAIQNRLRSEKVPIRIDQISQADGLDTKTREMLTNLGLQSILFLPLLDSGDEFIGSIGLDFKTPGKIRSETVDIARTITAQITVALRNVRLLEASRRQAERMEQIATFSRAVQGSLDVEELLRTGIQNVREIIASDYCALILYDATSGRPRRVSWQEATSRVVVSLHSGPFADLPATTSGVVWKGQDAIIVPDHRAPGALQFSGSRHVLSSLSVPIFSRGVLRGVMELGNNLQSAYTTTDRFILQQLVNQLAIAIENAEAYQQSQRVAQSKALVNDISVKLQQQTNMEQILNVTMNELGRALGAKRGRIRLTPDALNKDDERESGT